jgi:hypothetical protein
MLGPQQWLLVNLANEKNLSFSDRYKNKINVVPLKNTSIDWEVALDLSELFHGKIFVLFCWLGLVFVTPVFTIFVQFLSFTKKLASVSPF